MKKVIVIFQLFALTGCTNYLYQGQIRAPDSQGAERNVVLYWSKTDPLFGRDKAGPISLLTQCGSLITFDERIEGIVFRGEAGRETIASTGEPVIDGHICGRVLNEVHFTELGEGDLELTVLCNPAAPDDEGFGVVTRRYISANQEPYHFDIRAVKKWSLFGSIQTAPPPPDC